MRKAFLILSMMAGTRSRFMRLENETAVNAEGLIGIANDFREGEWLQLAPIGNFPHARGMQRVDADAVTRMANQFNGLLAKAGRALFGGVPFYEGHPDVPGLANEYPDRKAYGWVKALEARADGLYGQVEWSEAGKTMLANKHYKYFSPYWDARVVGTEGGKNVYQPIALLSVGLTNNPNLPVKPLANEKEATMEPTMKLAALVALLGLANTATEADITTAIGNLKTEAGKVTGLANEKTTAATALSNEQTEHGKTKTALANAIKQRNTLALDNAVKAGKITVAQRAEWETKLAENFEENSKALENSKPVIKTEAQTAGMGGRRGALANEGDVRSRMTRVQGLVNAKMKTGLSYDEAYAAVKLENAALFESMITPESGDEK